MKDLQTQSLGADLRALRKTRGMTLVGLAKALDRSVGWLSQVERGISTPTIADLRELAQMLDVPLESLAHDRGIPGEEGLIVRKHARRPIGSRAPGLVEGLLSPDLTDDFEMLHAVFGPHSSITTDVRRFTQEVGYIVSGRLNLWIDGTLFDLEPGDSFRIRKQHYRWANPYDEPCVAIWTISPPTY